MTPAAANNAARRRLQRTATASSPAAPRASTPATSSDADGDAADLQLGIQRQQRRPSAAAASRSRRPSRPPELHRAPDGRPTAAAASRARRSTLTVTAGPASAGSVDTTIGRPRPVRRPLADVTGRECRRRGRARPGRRPGLARRRRAASPRILRLRKAGYADQIEDARLAGRAPRTATSKRRWRRGEPALTLADAAAGGTLVGRTAQPSSSLPALVDAAGAPVRGPVQVAITPIDVAADVRSFPGRFEGPAHDGRAGPHRSATAPSSSPSRRAGQPVQLAPGRSATIEIPIYIGEASRRQRGQGRRRHAALVARRDAPAAGSEEGIGTVVASATSPSGFALRAEVTHFSWWNSDAFGGPPGKPKPKCLVDTNADGVLEDLTGTGYCWHAGTRPGAARSIFSSSAAPAGRKQALQSAGSSASRPGPPMPGRRPAGGVVLPIPAGLDITFRSYAKNGTLFGTKIVNLASGVEEDVPILLEPVAGPTRARSRRAALRRALRHRRDRRDRPLHLRGRGRRELRSPGRAQPVVAALGRSAGARRERRALAAGGFATGAFATVVSGGAGGTMTVEVTAAARRPAATACRSARSCVSDCGTPQAVTLPQILTVPHRSPPARRSASTSRCRPATRSDVGAQQFPRRPA